MIPFAVVGSERTVVIDGKSVRGRKNRWGVINVEDEKHCEFVYLRNFLTRQETIYLGHGGRNGLRVNFTGRTYKTSSKRRRKSITKRSGRSSCSLSRSHKPTHVPDPEATRRLEGDDGSVRQYTVS